MNKRVFSIMFLFLSVVCNAQITTYFYGRDKIQSKNETAALYSVEIYENNTRVTVELIPTKNRSRMNYWTSRNTYIIVDDNIELPILGFLRERNGAPIVDTDPFSGQWGWSNVKKDAKYHYTMVFAGKIPPGVTNFTLKDKGTYDGSHGYGFSNYKLNNPNTGSTTWTEASIKQFADENNDGICGIYEGSGSNEYKLGCIKQGNEYKLLYLGGKERLSWWQIGDTKAILRNSATTGFFKGEWYMQDKTSNSDCYVVFDGGSMKTIIDKDEEFYLKMYPTSTSNGLNAVVEKWTGTGFALNGGYIVTNYHVVENATAIKVQGVKGDFNKEYNATVVSTDKTNDLAIIKISAPGFTGFGNIPYKVRTTLSEVGEDVFVLGYPLTSTMGDEIKLTTGIISSKTGFQGDVSLYQISAPIQPGNSGGPVFDGTGNLIGIVNAKHKGAENVSYAIKSSYLGNLIESATNGSVLPTNNTVSSMTLSNKVKSIKNFVFLITCSSGQGDDMLPSQDNIVVSYPTVSSNTLNDSQHHTSTQISKVTIGSSSTIIELTLKNYGWCQIEPSAYIYANGKRYTLQRSEGIATSPQKTYPSYRGADIVCRLYFPPIPKSTTSLDLIESQSSRWKFYGVKLK